MPPKLAVQTWPGMISYVPQDVLLIPGSVAQNIALGFLTTEIDFERIKEVLQMVQLEEFLQSPESHSLEPGSGQSLILSGGQRQRLGIARALYTSPKLLILDEATSALDGITESAVSLSLSKLKGEVTVILIAHRLSTVVNANRVVYVDKGRILAHGTFDEVRRKVPNFNQQAEITGL
jgi:ABC-type bacteriocin/lantibiotic exporter with double-glycine peptidase domain